ncbi:hypothetical protein FEDK69T_31660 [Flavobacterium enshiense DK69]|uniref:Uncharacterized protein n=1 Tax=Flavobacterium enshiense DK69 TaxID=1107311 RepID=V6RZA1_9FLAO|nr:hypothetical protein FEDK69T_31660 [Flavobacterium enshiense DK69]KGO92807.1 hypothetical protein Q767_15280 [Flavobacterium enshiense DK69]
MAGLGFIGNGQCLHFSPIFQLFSFKLFGIFVNISTKNPPLLKAGGTLTVMLKKRNLKIT